MQKPNCTHIRIRDGNDYKTSVEDLIKEIEKEFSIDFRSIRHWQNVVKRLHAAQTDCLRKVQCANLEKAKIIEKLYIEATRPTPFQLNEVLARTASKWRNLGKPKQIAIPPLSLTDEVVEEEEKEEDKILDDTDLEALHPNTETSSADRAVAETLKVDTGPVKVDAEVQYELDPTKQIVHNLPVAICTNTHKLVSPLGSNISPLSFHSVVHHLESVGESKVKEWQPCTSAVICKPAPIRITNKTLKQQSLTFSLTNCTSEYLHVRFKYITNYSPFKKVKLLPKIPKRLYPGIAVVFQFLFKLQTQEDFETGLYFRIGYDVYTNAPTEPLFVPVLGTFRYNLKLAISESVSIPPVYPWHIKIGPDFEYPTGIVKITNDELQSYHLHIHKRPINLYEESMLSIEPNIPDTDLFKQCESFLSPLQSASSVKIDELADKKSEPTSETSEIKRINSTEYISMVLDDIVQFALDAFIFDSTYKYLSPHSKISIPVLLTKAEHIGYHHDYFDFDFIDPETDTVIITKTTKILAEILPYPITIAPVILDMSKSPLSLGYYEECFTVTNSHRICPATIYIKLTTKMKKMFYVEPMKCLIPAQSSVTFEVKFCSRDYLATEPCDDLVHFTFKIICVGDKMVYKNIPPIFYEIIAPCAMEFRKVYNEKYYPEPEQLQPVSEHAVQNTTINIPQSK